MTSRRALGLLFGAALVLAYVGGEWHGRRAGDRQAESMREGLAFFEENAQAMRRVRRGLAPPWAAINPPTEPHSRCALTPLERPSLWTRLQSWFHFHDALVADLGRFIKRMTAAEMQRDAAISLLLETPVECSDRAPLPGRCGTCWTCRVDKFLRDAGVRR